MTGCLTTRLSAYPPIIPKSTSRFARTNDKSLCTAGHSLRTYGTWDQMIAFVRPFKVSSEGQRKLLQLVCEKCHPVVTMRYRRITLSADIRGFQYINLEQWTDTLTGTTYGTHGTNYLPNIRNKFTPCGQSESIIHPENGITKHGQSFLQLTTPDFNEQLNKREMWTVM